MSIQLEIKPQQVEAINLLVYGRLNKKQVAEKLGIEQSTITAWFKKDFFIEEYNKQMRASFAELAAQAQQTIIDIMVSGEKENNRLTAAKDILSRGGFDATSKVEQTSETTIKVSVNDTD